MFASTSTSVMSNTGHLNLRLSYYFPWTFRIPGVVGLGISIGYVLENIYGSVAGILVCLTVLITHYRFDIDPGKKEYQDYLWIFGLRKGEKQSYQSIEYLGILKKQIRRTYNSRGSTSTIVHTEYEGFILFQGKEKVELISSENKRKVSKRMDKLSKFLGVEIRDLSNE